MKKPTGAVLEEQSSLTLKRQLVFWLVALGVLIGLLWLLNEVLLPFIAGMALAYLLDPLVKRIQRLGVHRAVAAVIIVVVVIAALVATVIIVVPILSEQLSGFLDRLPGYIERVQ